MKEKTKRFLLLGAAFFLLNSLALSRAFAWWDPNWVKRKPITITDNSGFILANYSIEINVTYNSDMNSGFSDLRFADSNDNELGYWIESKSDGNWANIWVMVPEIPASSSTTIYMYYSNSGATSASNGSEAFLWFDKFKTDTRSNYVKPSNDGSWSYDSTNEWIETSCGDNQGFTFGIPSSEVWAKNVKLTYDYKCSSQGADSVTNLFFHVRRSSGFNGWADRAWRGHIKTSGSFSPKIEVREGDSQVDLQSGSQNEQIGVWYDMDLSVWEINSTHSTGRFNWDGTVVSGTHSWDNQEGMVTFKTGEQSGIFDNMTIRKYMEPRPSKSVGSEQGVAAAPEVILESPADGATKNNPVNFTYTPICYSSGGCEKAELFFNLTENVTYNWLTDTETEWNQGSFTNTTTDGNGNLVLEKLIGSFYDGFEHSGASDGGDISANSDWVDDAMSVSYDSGTAADGTTYSAYTGSTTTGTPIMHRSFSSKEVQPKWISFWYRETSNSHGHGVTYRDGSQNRILGFYTNNPEFGIYDANGFNGGQASGDLCGSSSYTTWYKVNITFDWSAGTFSFKRSDGCSGSDYSLGSATGLQYVYLENANSENWATSDNVDSWWDELEIKLPKGYRTSGNYSSKTFDAGDSAYWKSSDITADVPANTDYNISYAENSSGGWNYYDTFPTNAYARFFKYNFSLAGDGTDTPTIDKVNISYDEEKTTWESRKTNQTPVVNNTVNWIEYNFSGLDLPKTFKWNIKLTDSIGQTDFGDLNRTVTVEGGVLCKVTSDITYTSETVDCRGKTYKVLQNARASFVDSRLLADDLWIESGSKIVLDDPSDIHIKN